MSRETLTLFTIFFLIIFGFGSAIVVSGIYEAPSEGVTIIGTISNIFKAFKEFYVEIPVFGTLIITTISVLIAYVLYREARGGL